MLAEAKHISEDKFHMAHHDEAIIGRSAALHEIMDQVGSVAPTNATVLLTEKLVRVRSSSPAPLSFRPVQSCISHRRGCRGAAPSDRPSGAGLWEKSNASTSFMCCGRPRE